MKTCLISCLNIEFNAPVLDIGCGNDAWLDRLADNGFTNLHGINLDINQFVFEKATCSRANLDYDNLGLGERKFSLITSIELIEHLENSGRIFSHVVKHLDTRARATAHVS